MDAPEGAKRILFFITKASWGGAQRYVFDLAIAAQSLGHEVAVAHGTEGELATRLDAAGVRRIPLSSLSRDISLQAEFRSFKEIKKILKEEKPDILHVNSSKAGLALLAARLMRVPKIIFTAHGWAFNERRPWWQKSILRIIYGITVYLADITVCVSSAIRNDISWLPFTTNRFRVIRHGIDAPHFPAKEAVQLKLLPLVHGKTWLGMIAELHATKRVEDAILALNDLKEEYPDLILVVLGEGELREWLTELIEKFDLNERVHLLGFVPEAASLVSAFDIFLMPSRSEALGYALIEAGYAGLPAIGSRVGGIPEVITHKETGLLVPAKNPHALARAIRSLLKDPAYAKELGDALQKTVQEKFSKKRMLEETLSLYN